MWMTSGPFARKSRKLRSGVRLLIVAAHRLSLFVWSSDRDETFIEFNESDLRRTIDWWWNRWIIGKSGDDRVEDCPVQERIRRKVIVATTVKGSSGEESSKFDVAIRSSTLLQRIQGMNRVHTNRLFGASCPELLWFVSFSLVLDLRTYRTFNIQSM